MNRRFENALRQGGSADTEAAVEAALDWLAAQQTPEGVWAAAATGAGAVTPIPTGPPAVGAARPRARPRPRVRIRRRVVRVVTI